MKNILILFLLLSSLTSCAQKNKLKNFEIVSYEIASPDNVEINSYSKINDNGKLDVYINGSRGKAYYSYQLTEEEVQEINKLYQGTLTDFIARKKLAPNNFYAGARNFITFEKGGKQKSLSYIIPFMNTEFTQVSNLLADKIYKQNDSAKIEEFKIDFIKLKKEIINQDKIDNYLPEKQNPPPPMMPRK